MDEQLELGFALLQPLRQPASRTADPFALQPWEKNTFEPQILPSNHKNKTFYRMPASNSHTSNYSVTQRAFSSPSHNQLSPRRHHSSLKKQRQSSDNRQKLWKTQQSAVTPCIISPTFVTEPSVPRRFSNQFFLRNKEKRNSKTSRQLDSPVLSFQQIKKRVGLKRQSSYQEDSHYIALCSQNNLQVNQSRQLGWQKKRTKVIALGFHRISAVRSLLKQKSVQVDSPF